MPVPKLGDVELDRAPIGHMSLRHATFCSFNSPELAALLPFHCEANHSFITQKTPHLTRQLPGFYRAVLVETPTRFSSFPLTFSILEESPYARARNSRLDTP